MNFWDVPARKTVCTCCGEPATATIENEGYSACCNDRIGDVSEKGNRS